VWPCPLTGHPFPKSFWTTMKRRAVRLDYGRQGLEVLLPAPSVCQVLDARHTPPLDNPQIAVETALRQPIGSPALAELAHNHRQALITVSDRTRPVPNRLLLPAILKELERGGIPRERVTVLVATGLHRAPLQRELLESIGEQVTSTCRVLGHDARDQRAQVAVGEVGGRTVWMNRVYVEAEFRIVTGLIEPHLMAGYSGGRKGICPGVLGAQSILNWHRPALLAHPQSRAGVTGGNPVDAEAHQVAALAPPAFLLNVTVDRGRRVTGVFAGDWRKAWSAGVAAAARATTVAASRPADVVVTSAAGYPLDTTFYQAIKGIAAAATATRPGGVIILAASLSEGVGSAEFQDLFRQYADAQSFLKAITATTEVRIDQWQLQVLAQVLRRASVWVYSEGIAPEALASLYVEPLASVEEGIERARTLLGPDCSVLCLPEGPYVVPVLKA